MTLASRDTAIRLVEDLNPAQREAVEHPGGPLLILAGAGSGKTRVLTRRIAWLVRRRGVSPQRILAVTFTNKAAGEMRARIGAAIAAPVTGLWIGTFHALCLRWLKRHAAMAGYRPGVSVFDTDDQRALLRRLLKSEGLDDTPRRARDLQAIISRAKNRCQDADELARTARAPAQRLAARLYREYQLALQRQNAVDFDDLLLVAHRLFSEQSEIADRYGEQFEHILVDEYQDTNHVQFRLVERLARRHRNIFVVGDDDQSIYGWRGADVRNILDFKEHFPDAAVIYLEQNYRSTQPILELANEAIRRNAGRWEKRLWTERTAGERPEFFLALDEDGEADEIAARVLRAKRAGRPFREMAVFYRTHAQSRALEDAFLRRAVPYVIVGGIHFYARREVKDLLAYLRILVNPADETSLRRALAAPRRGVGERSIGMLLASAAAQECDPIDVAAGGEADVRGRAAQGLRAFGALIRELRARVAEPPERILEEIVSRVQYERYLESQGGDWEERVANVHELLASARLFSSHESEGGVAAYLDQVSLMTTIDTVPEDADAVTLMTVHNAKGLEFPAVFVTGLEEGLLPHASALDDEEELEEERRLFYVACTRAQHELTLSASQIRRRFSSAGGGVSRFLLEIPARLLREEAAAAPPALPTGRPAEGPHGGSPPPATYRPAAVRATRSAAWRPEGVAPEASCAPWEHPLVGRRVAHATFGEGIVTAAEGRGDQTRVTVRFHGGRTRKVLKNYLEWEA